MFGGFSKTLVFSIFLALLCGHAAGATVQVQGGSVTLPATSNGQTSFYSVSFNSTFSTVPVVVAGPIGSGGAGTCALRIRNITTSGFEVAQVEPPGADGQHAAEPISWLAMETTGSGQYINLGGLVMQAGTLSTTQTVQKNPPFSSAGGHTTATFGEPFSSAPVVLAEIQTMNNESATDPPPGGPSTVWLTTSIASVNTTSFNVALERAEVDDGGTVSSSETIGFIAAGQGTGSFTDDNLNSILLDSLVSGNVIGGGDGSGNIGTGTAINFNQTFSSAPLTVASLRTRNGADGSWLRTNGTTSTAVTLLADEDQYYDTERSHADETASLFVFSQSFNVTATVIPEPATITLLAAGLAGLCLRRRRRV